MRRGEWARRASIYEPLLQFDIAQPPKYYPWLATGYTWSNGGKSVTFAIRQGVKFNNGTAMTPADVVFTYQLVAKTAAINLAGLPITSVTSSGNNVTVNFSSAEYLNLQEVAGVPIVPKSIWASQSNPSTFTDSTPVGTGPYMLKTFTPQGFTLTKNASYWQASMAKVQNVYFPVYTSNTGALSALYSGKIDWTGNFIPGLQKNFVSTAPQFHHFWEAPGSTNALMPNLNKWPTNQLAVRKAISLAVNRNLLASEGEAGLENPITNTSGITLPTFAAWAGPAAVVHRLADRQRIGGRGGARQGRLQEGLRWLLRARTARRSRLRSSARPLTPTTPRSAPWSPTSSRQPASTPASRASASTRGTPTWPAATSRSASTGRTTA